MNRRDFLSLAAGSAAAAARVPGRTRPNIVFIYTDDMGYGDLGCMGGRIAPTPNIDRLAAEGVRFTKFYVASPICSPSRVGVTTGMFPSRWRINDFLHQRAANRDHGADDWLDPRAPVLARSLRQSGYATGHFGKWHMGGGRDVQDAPEPAAYGFDESLTQFEGMGPRIDPNMPRNEITATFIDRALRFIRQNREKPFYVNLWPMDLHSPHVPVPAGKENYHKLPEHVQRPRFGAVLEEYDRQIGRFLKELNALGLDDRTLVLFTGDNGPQPDFNHERTGGLRGMKWSLYEGGIREPLIVRWKGVVPSGRVDNRTVMAGVDLFPSLAALAGSPLPSGVAFDGEDLSSAMLGRQRRRTKPLYWEYGRKPDYLYPPKEYDRSPNVALRDGNWKLLVNADGSRTELYDVEADPKETNNLAERDTGRARALRERALAWRNSLP
jgi:arylsulfatase A-like enzyme